MEAAGRGTVLYCLVLLLAGLSAGEEDEGPILGTRYGKLRGKTITVKGTERTVNAFYGIPFAKPPVGSLRFATPEPPEPWNSVREATEQPPMCLQNRDIMKSVMDTVKVKITIPPVSEDCLYLNVFTPADCGQDAKLPVMVFIHGGGLFMGAALMFEGPALSAYENVVIVSIQYRLGVLGFLSGPDAPGNYGFHDQVQSLRWIQENIKDFGGDPDCVTIFGESAGGISVSALVLSPLAKGLFHRAIAESGTALLPGLMAKTPGECTFFKTVLANVSGCDENAMLKCMKAKSEEEILSITKTLQLITPPATVDGVFLPKPAEQILAEKENNPVPFMTGFTEQECGWVIPAAMNITGFQEGMTKESVTDFFHGNPLMASLREVTPVLLEEYIGDETDPVKIRSYFQDLCGDFIFAIPALKTAKYHRDSGHPVYVYEFRRRPALFDDSKPDFVMADHGDELYFVIGGPFLPDGVLFAGATAVKEEEVLSKAVMSYWANFARTGNPNGPGLTHWPQYNQDEDYLQIDLKQKASQRLKDRKYNFWTNVLPEEMKKQQLEDVKDHSEL